MVKTKFYETPEIKVSGLHSEGVVCQSGPFNNYGLQDFTDGDIEDESGAWN